MIIIFDTNIWISDLALMSKVGSAVRFYLRKERARIGLPEVVKLETEFHLRKILVDHIDDIKTSHRQLLAVFGSLKEVVLPSEEEVETLISKVFSNIGVEILEYPFTLESAKASLIRTINKLPPSDKNQQFKDGVLWEDCLTILKDEPVYLVTEDKAFYKNRDAKLGLADKLTKDLGNKDNEFKIFPSLSELLSKIKTEVVIDTASLLEDFMKINGDKIRNIANKHSFAIDGEPKVTYSAFVTERPSLLYFTFEIELLCSDVAGEGRIGARILASGEGTYDAEEKRFIELANRGEKLLFQLPDGTEKKFENYVMVLGNIVFGHRTVEHSVRHEL